MLSAAYDEEWYVKVGGSLGLNCQALVDERLDK